MEQEKDFQHESVEDSQSIIQYLQSLAEGFRNRKLDFHIGPERFFLEPSGLIQVEIKAKKERRKSKLSLKFSWKDPSPAKKASPLSILTDRG